MMKAYDAKTFNSDNMSDELIDGSTHLVTVWSLNAKPEVSTRSKGYECFQKNVI